MKRKELVYCALGIALVFITTFFIKIPAAHGYFNLGDAVILLFASIISPLASFLLGGIGSCLADLSGGYAQYALFTLIVKGTEAILVTVLLQRLKWKPILVFVLAAIWMVIGYFFCDWMIYQQIGIAAAGLLMNSIQGAICALIAIALYPQFKRLSKQ